MPTVDLGKVAVESARLQNGYALAVDTRDWDYFRTLFTPDVLAFYPKSDYNGIESWLESFIPFHDECTWTLHMMANHVVGEDGHGIWGTCYGWVQWVHNERPGHLNRVAVLYRDRLQSKDGTWRIARRKLDLLMHDPAALAPAGIDVPRSVLDLADRS